MTSESSLFTRNSVAKAKAVVANPDEPADPERGGGFAEWAMLTLHTLRIELNKSYCVTLDLLSEIPAILDEIGLTWLPHSTSFCDWFEAIPIQRHCLVEGVRSEQAEAVGVHATRRPAR